MSYIFLVFTSKYLFSYMAIKFVSIPDVEILVDLHQDNN
jgi:hypothetical protein